MPKFVRWSDSTKPDEVIWLFLCPGCRCGHLIRTKGPEPCWAWNDDPACPTVVPSIMVGSRDPNRRCHGFIRNGKIEFRECAYSLSHQTVDLPELTCDPP